MVGLAGCIPDGRYASVVTLSHLWLETSQPADARLLVQEEQITARVTMQPVPQNTSLHWSLLRNYPK